MTIANGDATNSRRETSQLLLPYRIVVTADGFVDQPITFGLAEKIARTIMAATVPIVTLLFAYVPSVA
jgi:hypothetical protein